MRRSMKRFAFFLEFIYFVLTYMYVSSFMLLSENIYGHKVLLMEYSMKLKLTHVCSLSDFQLLMGLFRGHPPFLLSRLR